MNVTQDLSILHLILQASAVVQVVMALLAGVSLMSWYYIFMKLFAVKQAREKTENFERDFWSGGDLNNLFNSAVNDRHHAGSMERIFEAGFREFTKLRARRTSTPRTSWTARAAPCAHLPARDGCARVAPRLPRLGRLGLPVHRPVRHRLGHHARLPRPVQRRSGHPARGAGHRRSAGRHRHRPVRRHSRRAAYNRFSHDIDRLAVRYESFMEEFSNIIQRQMR
jgi:biopolymer transport protein TolQ